MQYYMIDVVFGSNHTARTETRYQWNRGQVLRFNNIDLPENFQVHFSHSVDEEAKTEYGNSSCVNIPDYYFEKAGTLFAWIYLQNTEDDGTTVYTVTIPIAAKSKPGDQEIPESE